MADFGYSFLSNDGNKNVLFEPAKSWPWYAPEHHHRGFSIEQGQRQDAFSFGMLCFWVLFQTELSAEAQISLDKEGALGSAAERNVCSLLQMWKLEKKLEAVALEMVAARFNSTERDVLTHFFKSTLTCDPNKREKDFQKLESLLKRFNPERYVPTILALDLA